MLYIQELWQKIVSTHENIRGKIPGKARWGIIALLAVLSFIIFIFSAEWLMTRMVAMLPLFYVTAVLAVGFKRALYGTAIFLFCCFALWLRTGPPYDGVLGGSYVMFAENDGWYHARLIENLVAHFPKQITFDPYTYYPYGQELYMAPFFDWLIALFIWIAGLGHPLPELTEKMAAYFPAVLGTLTIIPVYFIGRELINRNFGLLVAGLLAIAPGEFLFRSILGFTDHHIIEVLLSTTTILFLILAIKRGRETRPTFAQIKNREWACLKRPLIYSLLAGFVLGLYALSWVGAALFILILFVYMVVQYITDHLRGESTDYLCIIAVPLFLLSFIMFSPFYKDILNAKYVMLGLSGALITAVALFLISYLMNRFSLRKIYYPLAIAVLALAAILLIYLISPSFFKSVINIFGLVFKPSTVGLTIMEVQPLLGGLDISALIDHRLWSYFTMGMVLAPIAFLQILYSSSSDHRLGRLLNFGLIGMVILTVILDQWVSIPWQLYLIELISAVAVYSYFERSDNKKLLIIWSSVILLAMLGQTRFAYYFAVNAVLLSGYLLWRLPGWISFGFKTTSKTWLWLTIWIALITATLIIDKTTYISVPSIIYAVEGIAAVSWIAYKLLAPSSEPAIESSAEKRKAKEAKKRGETAKESNIIRSFKPQCVTCMLYIVILFSSTIYPNFIYSTYDQNVYPDRDCYQTNTERCPSCSAALYLPHHPYGPNTDWHEALTWMRSVNSSTGQLNTPDPFGDDELYINGSYYGESFYYDMYQKPAPGETYDYPDSAYGVMSWWDYGHWITRIAHRIPIANPHQKGIGGPYRGNTSGASTFMTAQDEATASAIMDELDSRYVVIDIETAYGKYHTMVTWSGGNVSDYYDILYREPDGEVRTFSDPGSRSAEVQIFFPDYYQSMCARLYNFGTEAAVPNNSTWVILYEEATDDNGERYRYIASAANGGQAFPTYEEALASLESHPGYIIVGLDPFTSPIPLEALTEYEPIHSSPSVVIQRGTRSLHYVEVFEYTGYEK